MGTRVCVWGGDTGEEKESTEHWDGGLVTCHMPECGGTGQDALMLLGEDQGAQRDLEANCMSPWCF